MKTGWTAPALLLLAASAQAQAQAQAQGQGQGQGQGPSALYVKSLAANCANCHGTDGRTVEGSAVPSLAGMPRDYMIAQLRAFKAGTRPATVMHQLSKGFSDGQVEQIAGYFAAQKK